MNKKRSNEALQRPGVADFKDQTKYPVVVVLDNVRSLANVGSIFRTADAFNIESLVLCGITGRPPHREIQRTALGATESVHWTHAPSALDTVKALKDLGYLIASVEQCEQHVEPGETGLLPEQKICLVFGNEVEGVSQEVVDASDLVIEIPQAGTKHSLNVTVAAGVVLWEVFKVYHHP